MCPKCRVVTRIIGRRLLNKHLDQIEHFKIIDNNYLNIKIKLYIINNVTSYTL